MESNSKQMRPGFMLTVGLVALALVMVVVWRSWAQASVASQALRQESQQLRAQLEERDHTIKDLQATIRQLRGLPGGSLLAAEDPRMSGSLGIEVELSRRLAELTVLQSNMLALVERLTTKLSTTGSLDAVPKGGQAVVSVLEDYLAQYQEQAEAAKQKAAGFLVTLNVPTQIASMEAKAALDSANLSAYWPYFEAKRDRETALARIDRLRRELERAKVSASIEAATSGAK